MTDEQLDIFSDKVLDVVSANVKKYCELKNYSQIQLALEIGMSSGAYLGRAKIRKDGLIILTSDILLKFLVFLMYR